MTMELVALIYFIINLLSLYTPKDNFLTFINKPETIIQNGTIYKRSYNTPTTERIFIHLKNGTDKNQTLYIKTTKPLIYNKENLYNPHFIAKTKALRNQCFA